MSSPFPGPPELGRGIVVRPGEKPDGFDGVLRVRVDERTLVDHEEVCARLHRAWLHREPLVVELAVAPEELKRAERCELPVYSLDPTFEFARDRLRFLSWANNYDGLGQEPIWWHARLAERAGARPHPEAEVDLNLGVGPLWCDGGPRASIPYPVLHRESIESGRLRATLSVPEGDPQTAELAEDQRRAVFHRGGAARVLAPAGSGKTRVLTSRCRYLLACGFEGDRVTALAYNRRAAQSMLERLGSANHCQVRTLHALGYSWLRQNRNVRLASDSEVRGLLGSIVKTRAQLNQDPLMPYLEAMQKVRLGLCDPSEVEGKNEELAGFAAAFERYREALAERGWVDHDEQIYGAIELLLQDPEARRRAQRSCTHLLVDEFQDLTPAFLLLVRLLSAPGYQVFAVGDDDQVIYGYAGATPSYLVDFKDYFPQACTYALEVNYRCPSGVVQAASKLLGRNKLRVSKLIRAASSVESHPRVVLAPVEKWAAAGLECVRGWLTHTGPENIAVLARVNALLMPIQIQLRQSGIEHFGTVDTSILRRTGIRTALSYFRLAQGFYDQADLSEALRRPNRKLRKEVVTQATRCRSATELRRYALKLDPWPASQFDEFLQDLALLERRLEKGVVAFFRALRTETGFIDALDQLDEGGLGASSSSHRDDLLALEQTAAVYSEATGVAGFEAWLVEALGPSHTPGQGLRLSSVHRVKGLEWDHVLIYGFDRRFFPHHLSEDVEEERRIFHVALTRARQECALLLDPESPSPYLKEFQ